jgi:shikimate kinase
VEPVYFMLNKEVHETGEISGQARFPARVVLTGFRTTGKSLVGSLLADLLGYRFVDTDDELVASIQSSVANFVREQGWPAFREFEKKLLARLAWMSHVVIATGGGAVLHDQEWRDLRKGSLVIWLQADASTIQDRLLTDATSHTQRPSLTGGSKIEEVDAILVEREPCYRQDSDIAIDTTDKTPEEIAIFIQQHIKLLEKE